MLALGNVFGRVAGTLGGRLLQAAPMSSATARKALGTGVQFTETLEDNSVFVSRVPETPPEISRADLPPRVRPHKPVPSKRLPKDKIQSLIKLRNEDPVRWTVSKLAKEFGVAPTAVLKLAPSPGWRQREVQLEADRAWEQLGYKKRLKRINRIRRRLLW
ncbi:hypothetical protein GGF46_002164 [Coemansia sp. RSA 552]|nr:hypothetical protein GGF46_002164 [Coemansia sp. RSA 552]